MGCLLPVPLSFLFFLCPVSLHLLKVSPTLEFLPECLPLGTLKLRRDLNSGLSHSRSCEPRNWLRNGSDGQGGRGTRMTRMTELGGEHGRSPGWRTGEAPVGGTGPGPQDEDLPRNIGWHCSGHWACTPRFHDRRQGGELPGGRGRERGRGGSRGAPTPPGITEESRNPPEGLRKHTVGTKAESPWHWLPYLA